MKCIEVRGAARERPRYIRLDLASCLQSKSLVFHNWCHSLTSIPGCRCDMKQQQCQGGHAIQQWLSVGPHFRKSLRLRDWSLSYAAVRCTRFKHLPCAKGCEDRAKNWSFATFKCAFERDLSDEKRTRHCFPCFAFTWPSRRESVITMIDINRIIPRARADQC